MSSIKTVGHGKASFFAQFSAALSFLSKLTWMNSRSSIFVTLSLCFSNNCGTDLRQGGHQLAVNYRMK